MSSGLFVKPPSRRKRKQFPFQNGRGKSHSHAFTFGEPTHLGPARGKSFVPNIIKMFWRFLFLFMLQIGWMVFSAVIIMGEDVFWRFAYVDNLYTRAGTNPLDAWTFWYLVGYMVIWFIGVFWAVGAFALFDDLWA